MVFKHPDGSNYRWHYAHMKNENQYLKEEELASILFAHRYPHELQPANAGMTQMYSIQFSGWCVNLNPDGTWDVEDTTGG